MPSATCRRTRRTRSSRVVSSVLAEGQALFEKEAVIATDRQRRFLIDFDLDYAQRRLRLRDRRDQRLVPACRPRWIPHARATRRRQGTPVGGCPHAPPRDERKRLRRAGRPALPHLLPRGRHARVHTPARVRLDPQEYVDDHGDDLAKLEDALRAYLKTQLATFTSDLYVDLVKRTKNWNDQRKWALLSRYLGFEFWDVLLYSVQALSDVGERDKVEVVRLSPARHEAHREAAAGGAVEARRRAPAPLRRVSQRSRRGAAKDYLWGRLDGAERLLGIVLRDAPEDDKARWFKEVGLAILEEDKDAVPNASDLVSYVRSQIGG